MERNELPAEGKKIIRLPWLEHGMGKAGAGRRRVGQCASENDRDGAGA